MQRTIVVLLALVGVLQVSPVAFASFVPQAAPHSQQHHNLNQHHQPTEAGVELHRLHQVHFTKNLVKLITNNSLNRNIHPSSKLNHLNLKLLDPSLSLDHIAQSIAASRYHQADGHPHSQPARKVDLLEKICIGTSNRLDNITDTYQNLVERYNNCTYVIGNLEITWLNNAGHHGEPLDLSFLESVREITGYLLIAHSDIEHIRMPNLQIIRGRDVFKKDGDGKGFAMAIIETGLKTLELPNLREVLAGNVGFYDNKYLCYVTSIDWEEIINKPFHAEFAYNGGQPHCLCDTSCEHGACWGEGPELCQKFSKVDCSRSCSGRCYGSGPNDCCHSYCAGGCEGPKQTECLACKNFYDDGECIPECPSMQRYNPTLFSWEPNPNGKYAFGATCVKECPEHLLRDNGACVRTCPPNKRSSNGECLPCAGPCPKNCQGVEVVHSGNIDQFINCTIIEGSIRILNASFTGSTELATNNASLIRYKPMHPSQLEAFKTLREITGSLNIEAWHSDFRNLSYFRNLKMIGGRQTNDFFHALSIIKSSLVSLNLRSLRKVASGRIIIEDNRDLCFGDKIDWMQLNTTRREITVRNNAEPLRCQQLKLECHKQCAQDGCWGPGPDECLSCNNYKLDDYCVDDCAASQAIGLLSFDSGNRTCTRCHPECKGGCNGTEALHCHQCRGVKDGPYCVSSCPSHKYDNNGVCEECDGSCLDSCTGTSNRLGVGGCNSCARTVINHTEPAFSAYCLRAEQPCPEGFYQEYHGPQSEGPLKSASGKPVCRKCHQRCKSCTGMGTLVSVCECAKYVAGEQCEDYCPRDYYADDQRRRCVKCSPECNGCYGPSEAECTSCRAYRIYYDQPDGEQPADEYLQAQPPGYRQKFNCTAQCPAHKPYRISDGNMLDPFCSEKPGVGGDSAGSNSFNWLALLVVVVVVFVVGCCWWAHRCQMEQNKKVKLALHFIDDAEPLTPSHMKPNLAPLRSIKETELRKGNKLGSGFGGTVYQGLWFPDETKPKEYRPVAIKELRDNGQGNINKEFLEEAYVMASVNHPNLVRLLAVCMTPKHLMLVTQLMPLGCLLDHVRKCRHEISAKDLFEWCKQVAKGMAYLEGRRLVHRDLALRNVLLQPTAKTCRALISDFGLAKFLDVDQTEYLAGGGRLPIKWLAPECIREKKFTHKSDVWAFGVTVWELLTFGQRPFENYDTKDVPAAIEKGARLHQPAHMTAEVYKVIYSCWFYNPGDRPNFKALGQSFMTFARDPERYLICAGTKGAPSAFRKRLGVGSESDDNELEEYDDSQLEEDDEDEDEEEEEDDDDDDECDDEDEDEDDEISRVPNSASTMMQPDLTPSTHNRLNQNNEAFHFDVAHPAGHLSESDAAQTPTLKELGLLYDRGGHPPDINNNNNGPKNSSRTSHHNNHQATRNQQQNARTLKMSTSNSCWSWNNNISSNSLSQKSEQPTDLYEYLLPSPPGTGDTTDGPHFDSLYCSVYGTTKFAPIKPIASRTTGAQAARGSNQEQQPHSATMVQVNNDEYFLTRLNYVNQVAMVAGEQRASSTLHRHSSTSTGNIPYSLV